jgi:hypothetical protein
VVFLALVAAATAGLYVMSLLNARTWSLGLDRSGRLQVLRGKMLPWGTEPFQPADPLLAQAYAPLDLQGNTKLALVGRTFAERDELDRALFSAIEMLAAPRVESEDRRDLELGIELVKRAEALRGLSETQRASLGRLRGEVAYFLAKQRIDEARRQLDEALSQLKLAADADARHKRDATQMLLSVEPQIRALSDTLRAAGEGLPAPAPPTPRAVPPVLTPSALDAGTSDGTRPSSEAFDGPSPTR